MIRDLLYRLKPKAFRHLEQNCERYLDAYRDPDADFDGVLRDAGYEDYREPVDVRITGPVDLGFEPGKDPRRVELGALKFYDSLDGMSPRLATDPTIFAYVNHFHLHGYGLARWGVSDDPKQAVTDIRNHWITFNGSFMGLFRQNTAGRIWWIAHTALMSARASNGGFTAAAALEKFVETTEYYNRIMEWEFLYNYDVMAECVRLLLNECEGISVANYRKILTRLNREAGGRILDALDRDQLHALVVGVARTVMS